jgi:hypothetical protein
MTQAPHGFPKLSWIFWERKNSRRSSSRSADITKADGPVPQFLLDSGFQSEFEGTWGKAQTIYWLDPSL